MAKIHSLAVRKAVGKLGGMVYYVAKGQSLNRELASSVSNPRSTSQMIHRTKLANLVNFYKANRSWMNKYSFEGAAGLKSCYNMFVKANLSKNMPALTKAEAAMGLVVPAANLLVTDGTLRATIMKSVSTSENSGGLLLECDILADVNPQRGVTVGQFSNNVLDQNSWLQEGDQISFIGIKFGASIPEVYKFEITLDSSSNEPLEDAPMENDGSLQFDSAWFGMQANESVGVVACVTRRTSSGIKITPSVMMLSNAATNEGRQYLRTSQLQAAIDSYGYSETPFLDPATENSVQSANKVTIAVTAGEGGSVTGAGRYEVGTQVTLEATANTGYDFDGWTKDGVEVSTSDSYTFTALEDATYVANFAQSE